MSSLRQRNSGQDNMKEYLSDHAAGSGTGSPLPEYRSTTSTSNAQVEDGGKSKRRKIWNIAVISVAIALIIVAVVVPVVLTRRSHKSEADRYDELYRPQGYNGTGENGALALQSPRQPVSYDRLLVFGSSYSDNAHPRAAQYSGSFAGSGYWERRWSNGPIWVEYLKDYLGSNVTHLNYAYGGATTNNSIHWANSPDTGQQMQTYLQEDYSSTLKPIVATFTTTNDITATFRDYLDPNSGIYQNLPAALSVGRQSAQSFINQLIGLIPNNTSAVAPDYLILPILPVELAPQSMQIASDANTSTDAIKEITRQYNNALIGGAKTIANRLGSRGTVFTYDVPSWYYAMFDNPSRYSLNRIDRGCLQVGCSNPKGYLWWDHLHLPTHMQQTLARLAANIVFNTTVLP